MEKCFGNFMIYPVCEDRYECEFQNRCLVQTNKEKGKCNCPYKASCHIWRQQLQVEFRTKSGEGLESCPFFKILKPKYEERNINS